MALQTEFSKMTRNSLCSIRQLPSLTIQVGDDSVPVGEAAVAGLTIVRCLALVTTGTLVTANSGETFFT